MKDALRPRESLLSGLRNGEGLLILVIQLHFAVRKEEHAPWTHDVGEFVQEALEVSDLSGRFNRKMGVKDGRPSRLRRLLASEQHRSFLCNERIPSSPAKKT
jgi:hypothetical protein